MFSFRRRPKDTGSVPPPLRTSPSLPELHAQGIPWPENLVDESVLRETSAKEKALETATPVVQSRQQGHPAHNGIPISSLYMSHPPSAFENWRSVTPSIASVANRRAHKKNRASPAFNLMVVGSRGTGKTSLLRLLLETSDISHTSTEEQRASLQRFLQGDLKQTQSINTACVEICESRYDRVLLTVIDTPGLDFSEGRELSVERQVTNIIKYIDQQYADTMIEESKVVRQSKGDQHIHLCIFMIDPSTIMSVEARRAKSSIPRKSHSETKISSSTMVMSEAGHSDQSIPGELTMFPADLRVIRRLSERVNVLPVIARADSLTDDALSAVKETVRKGVRDVGLGLGVFSAPKMKDGVSSPSRPREIAANEDGAHGTTNGASVDHPNGDSHAASAADVPKERASRPVISTKVALVSRSRSRTRRDLSAVAQDEREPLYPVDTDEQSVAAIRFSAQTLAEVDLGALLPFAFIAPEPLSSPRTTLLSPVTPDSKHPTVRGDPISSSTPVAESPTASLDSPIARKSVYNYTPPEDLKGMFTRKFRWGTVDVLNPAHCDFAALRTTILLTHMKVLKVHTREVLYEKYRTEKLLAKRATRSIGPEETKRLFEDLGL